MKPENVEALKARRNAQKSSQTWLSCGFEGAAAGSSKGLLTEGLGKNSRLRGSYARGGRGANVIPDLRASRLADTGFGNCGLPLVNGWKESSG